MKKYVFALEPQLLAEFFTHLDKKEMDFDLELVNEDGNLEVTVHYEPEEREEIMKMIEWVDARSNQEEEETEEEEEEEDDNNG